MSVYLVPADRKNLDKSIERDVPPNLLTDVPKDIVMEIQARAGAEGIRCWAMTSALRASFEKMQPGDLVLLSESGTGRFTYAAWVTFKLENKTLGDALWPFKGQNSWELIYFLRDIQPLDVPKADLVKQLGYQDNYKVYSTIRVQDTKLQAFEDQHGSLTEWLRIFELPPQFEEPAGPLPIAAEPAATDYSASDITGKAKRRQRYAQFAKKVKANYQNACAMCGITEKEFLVAGHIVAWAMDEQQRLNPANCMCLCVLHDRAFERGFIILDEEFHIRLTHRVDRASHLGTRLKEVEGQRIRLPVGPQPSRDLLKRHRELCLRMPAR
ncbi:HNH endonuclease [Myxococcus sp. RHSTA-1-4]|uniref:HNH endonuclease n=1 Tax=Myxococcus sp. RHSTA-1-4 TaxID=2874601 RepID=UPI001CBE6F53|nr:HNH endonuclease [Myxococcus sp. RHSTA-1-4]MBZ4418361.1 hypothetical protein [Myxococcus sp. RHSTA-1-4]